MRSKRKVTVLDQQSAKACQSGAGDSGLSAALAVASTAGSLCWLSMTLATPHAWAQDPQATPASSGAPGGSTQGLAPTPLNAILTKIVGIVKVNGKLVTRPQLLKENQVVETGENSSASVFFGTDGIVHLAADAKIKVNQLNLEKRANEIDVAHGKARVLVRSGGAPKTFLIRTRTATMGVRGTHILVDVPRDLRAAPQFVTFEGKAEVRPNVPAVQLAPGTPPPQAPVITLSKSEAVTVAGTGSGAGSENSPGNASGSATGTNAGTRPSSGASTDARAEGRNDGRTAPGNEPPRPETRKLEATETQRLVNEVAPLREIATPSDVKTIAEAPRNGDRPGTRGGNGTPQNGTGTAPGGNASDSSRESRGNDSNTTASAGAQQLLPGFGFGTNGGFGFTGGGTLLGQPGTGTGTTLDPLADGAGVARVTIRIRRND